MRTLLLLTSLCLICAVAAQAQSAPAGSSEVVNIPELIENALGNGNAAKLLSEYTYTLRMAQRSADKKGRITEESETFEAYFPTLKRKGETKFVLIKTRENDRPVPPEKLERERQKATERLLKAEDEAQRQQTDEKNRAGGDEKSVGVYFRINAGSFFSSISLDVRTLMKSCEFDSPRREIIEGRKAVALSFRPKAGASFEKEERYLAQSAGTIWIDAADKVLVRVEGWPRTASARSGNPAFVYEQTRLPDGHWLPRLGRMNGVAHSALLGSKYDFVFEFNNYQRFWSEIQGVKMSKPGEKP
jgi:hypothetical protein